MNVSRARFLTACGAALVGGTLEVRGQGLSGLWFASAASGPTAAEFRKQLETTFQVRTPDGALQDLRLVEVVGRTVDRRIEQFSLIFLSAPGTPLADGTYEVRHSVMEMSPIFISSVGRASSEYVTYEACFSRLLSGA